MSPDPGEQDEGMSLGSGQDPPDLSQEVSDEEMDIQEPDPPVELDRPRTRQ